MKKCLFLIAIIMLMLPSFIFADAGGPMLKPYEAYVSNFDGAEYNSYLDEKGTLPYGTKVEVTYEFIDENNIGYANCHVIGTNEYYSVKLADLDVTGDVIVTPDNLSIKSRAILKTNLRSIEMRKGPGELYGRNGVTISSGEEIDVFNYEGYEKWIFVKYKDNGGWIDREQFNLEFYPVYKEIVTIKDVGLKSFKDNTMIEKIPAYTKFTDYMYTDSIVLVEYNGNKGYIFKTDVAVEEKGTIQVNRDECVVYPLYDEFTDYSSYANKEQKIAKGTILSYNYRMLNQDSFFINYNGEPMQLYVSNEDIVKVEESAKKIDYKEPTTNYSAPAQNDIPQSQNNSETTSLNGTQIILICIGVALVVSITGMVVLTLLNKKNKEE